MTTAPKTATPATPATPVADPPATPAAEVHPMVTEHAKEILRRQTATTAGVKAGAMRRIGELELDMTLAGVPFTPYQRPATTTVSRMIIDRDDTTAKIAALGALLAPGAIDPMTGKSYRESVKDSADRRLTALLAACADLGWTDITDPRKVATPTA